VKDLSDDKVHVSFTAGREFEKDLLKVKALLNHKYPKGRLEEVLGLALKALLKDLKKPNSKASHIPRGMSDCDSASDLSSRAPQQRPRFYRQVPKPSRYIPRGMRAAIWERDGAKCQYISPEGHVCGETHFLEMDHRRPFALGGPSTEENLRLLCRAHNALAAEMVFGRMGRGT
jgi:5-methylcytosine-specific restriction endonuclease McrA